MTLRRRRAARIAVVSLAASGACSACAFWDMGDWSSREGQSADASADRGAPVDGAPDGNGSVSAYSAAVLADAPLGYWPLDETAGSVAHDASGHGHDATIEGGVAFGAAGAIVGGRGAATFSDGRIVVGDVFGFVGTSELSLEAWMRPTKVDGIFRRAGGKESTTTPRAGYDLWLHQEPGPVLAFERLVADDGISVRAPVPPGDAFFHLVATYTAGTMTLWIDGTKAASVGDSRPIASHAGAFLWGNSSFAQAPFVGVLDELAVYGTALGEARVRAHYAAGRGL